MKSSQQIVETIAQSIAQLYAEPHETAHTQCELNGLLLQLHWLLADATERMDEFVDARWKVFESDLPGWERLHQSPNWHAILDEPSGFRAIIEEWQRLDVVFGIAPERDS